MNKNLTARMPLAAVLMEIGLQAELRNAVVNLDGVPRLQNIEADALTNEEFEGLAMTNRVTIKPEKTSYLIMDKLLATAEAFSVELEEQKECKVVLLAAAEVQPVPGGAPLRVPCLRNARGMQGAPGNNRRRVSLKEREPWG